MNTTKEKIFLTISVITCVGGLTLGPVTGNPHYFIGVVVSLVSLILMGIWSD